jgi:6-phosphogluconolactonase
VRASSSVVPSAGIALAVAAGAFACSTEPKAADPSSTGRSDGGPSGDRDGAAPTGGGTDDGSAPAGDAGPDAALAGPLFAFVGSNDGKIRVYDVDPDTGALAFKKESNAGTNPSFLAFDPGRRRVVAVDEIGGMGQVRSFDFDPATGALAEIDAKPAGGAGSTHLSLDPAAKWVFVANYTGGNMAVLPLAPAGTLGAATDTKASGAKSHWAGTNPSGTHVFVPALEANIIAQYTLDATNGKLSNNGSAALPGGAGPRHLAFHPSESWAYCINELAVTVTKLDFDKATGKLTAKQTLSALPAGQGAGGVTGAEITVHPSGKWVYASTRGYNSIAHFAVNGADGALTLVANAPTGANQPRSFGMSPEGTLLFAGNQSANQIVGFRIDGATGALSSLGSPTNVTNPTFVGLARMP